MGPKHTHRRGNALFLILIAVALFAALAYAITQSGRGGSGGAARETQELDVSRVLQYAATMQNAVQRLVLTGGCTETGLDFYSTRWANPSWYDNTNPPDDGTCAVFDPQGGGVSFESPPVSVQGAGGTEYTITGDVRIMGNGTDTPQPNANELAFFSRVTRSMCLAINTRLGIANPGGEPPQITVANGNTFIPATNAHAFRGVFDNNNTMGTAGKAPELAGNAMGCAWCNYAADCPTAEYHFYSVLLAR